jgi:hypothetical protein
MREILSDGNLTRAIRGAQLSYAVGLGEPRGAASSMSSRTSIVSAAWKSISARKTTKKTEALIGLRDHHCTRLTSPVLTILRSRISPVRHGSA